MSSLSGARSLLRMAPLSPLTEDDQQRFMGQKDRDAPADPTATGPAVGVPSDNAVIRGKAIPAYAPCSRGKSEPARRPVSRGRRRTWLSPRRREGVPASVRLASPTGRSGGLMDDYAQVGNVFCDNAMMQP